MQKKTQGKLYQNKRSLAKILVNALFTRIIFCPYEWKHDSIPLPYPYGISIWLDFDEVQRFFEWEKYLL